MKSISNFILRFRSMSFKRMKMYVNAINKNYGKNKIVTSIDMINCALRYGVGYLDYTVFGFAMIPKKNRSTFLTYNKNVALAHSANNPEYTHFFKNKLDFNNSFTDYIGRKFINLNECTAEDFEKFFENNKVIFSKNPESFGGQKVQCLKTENYPDKKKLYENLKANGYILAEEKIIQHDTMLKLCDKSVNSLRVVTLKDKNGKIHYLYSLLRMGNGTKSIDNITSGGMYILLDENGKSISRAFCDKTAMYYEEHPYSHTKLTDFEVPLHKESVELCKKAATVIDNVGYIGWDVAITQDKPVLIEGNVLPGYDMCQNYELSKKETGILPVIHKIPGYENL